ncbi:RimJ/RimL family protein N-acetyltransferase [Knoellia remsis]|uniref:RimJ/RimL family protein N-acetyltransferase n=1 Tax=Knoellia remsis TaxID=407159 RepID=A0A2T0UN44_9MICO|nr:GNAT family N-acetyltransferase [Knoellia remsis]PRY59316.1 RimJ/RimL family protein N-acetyltransferase [Knoellia remsis]
MSEISVRPLGEEDWQQYRDTRLTALRESPEAFVATADEEDAYDEDFWRLRMNRSARLLAEQDGRALGIASVGRSSDDEPQVSELFGLWVTPEARGSGVATELVRAGANLARQRGQKQLVYWVGSDNGRAVAFASGFGFRPTAERRPMRVKSDDDEDEVAMVLPLGGDRGSVPTDF